jgi:glycerol-3-phosphate dehydrogenase
VRTLEEVVNGPPLDVVIVGGGINGCAVARELALRGLRVALFEKDDFGFGTTWRSTKLIHGGLRYLEHGDVRLVFESLRERAWLLRTRPHLVKPLRFLLPLLPWTRRPRWQLRAGLTAYDILAARGGLPRHRALDAVAARKLVPAIAPTAGALAFYDALATAPERLALELALEARDAGAAVFNHTAVLRVVPEGGRVAGVAVAQREGTAEVACRAVINAAGPWVDAVNAGGGARPLLGVTRGTHIALELEGRPPAAAILSFAKTDGRVFFAIPREGMVLVGTTDDRFAGEADQVRPTAADVAYLLDEAKELLPGAGIGPEAVRYAYAGLRPLQRVAGGPEAAITRRHAVVDHGSRGDGPGGLYSIVGGKLSTFRPLAEDVARALRAPAARAMPPAGCPAAALEGGRLERYGPRGAGIAALGAEVVCEHTGTIDGEVVHAIRAEMAATLSDIIMRRTGDAWGPRRGLCCHRAVAAAAARELGWTATETEEQVAAFERDIRRHLPALDEVEE